MDNPAPQEQETIPNRVVLNIDKVDELLEYVAAIQAPNLHRNRYDTGVPFLVVPDKLKVLDLEKHMPNPSRTRKHIKFVDAPSFISYVNAFKVGMEPLSIAKQNDSGLSIMTIFDYDVANKMLVVLGEGGAPDQQGVNYGIPKWGSHIAQLDLTYHPDYDLLRKHSDEWFSQEAFAELVEENTHLFFKPDSAFMYEMAQDLKVNVEASLRSAKRLHNGQVALQYTETVNGVTNDGQEVLIPQQLTFKCPLFEGLPDEEMVAVFRFRKQDRAVSFKYKLMTKLQERRAHTDVRKMVSDATGLPSLTVSTFDTKASS